MDTFNLETMIKNTLKIDILTNSVKWKAKSGDYIVLLKYFEKVHKCQRQLCLTFPRVCRKWLLVYINSVKININLCNSAHSLPNQNSFNKHIIIFYIKKTVVTVYIDIKQTPKLNG